MPSDQYLIDVSLRRDQVPSFDAYPFSLDAVKSLSKLKLHPKVTYLVGENGSGKSTLLEAIAIAWGFNPEGGSNNFSFGTYRSHSSLHSYLRLAKGVPRARDGFFLRAESFFNVATEIENLGVGRSYGDRSLHEQSHGESFFSLFSNRFGGNGLYILDEPEAALSPTRQMAMLSRMHQLVRDKSQFIIATHSPIVMAYPDALIYQLGPSGVSEVSLKDTEHYRVTRDFLARPDYFLNILLDDSDDS